MMRTIYSRNKAQSFYEYALMIALIAGAVIAMQIYIRRGLQGKLRDLADQVSPKQFEAGKTQSTATITRTSNIDSRQFQGEYDAESTETTTVTRDELITD